MKYLLVIAVFSLICSPAFGQINLNAYNVNNILYVDGTVYPTLASAFAHCPGSGCTIDLRGNSSSTALNIGNFDPDVFFSAPTLTAVSGSHPPAGTYMVEVTYVTSAGETMTSGAASITTSGGSLAIQVTSPPTYTGATGWNVYFTTAGGYIFYRQNSTPIAIGTNYTQSSIISTTTVQPPRPSVTILLGPYTYNVGTITIENGLQVIGEAGTTLQATSATAPIFALSQANVPASGVRLTGFQLLGASGNTADGIFLDCSNVTGGGMFYSKLQNLTMQNFNGVSLHLRGPSSNFGSNTQFSTFENIDIFRNSGSAGEALRVEGANSNMVFNRFQMTSNTTSGQNVYLGNYSGGSGGYPLSLTFIDMIDQNSNIGVVLNTALSINFIGAHFEGVKTTGYSFQGSGNDQITIIGNYFAGNGQFQNGGNGAIVDTTAMTTNNGSISFSDNMCLNCTADNFIRQGSSNTLPTAHNGNNFVFPGPTITAGFGTGTTIGNTTADSAAFTINVGASPTTGSATIGLYAAPSGHGWACTFTDIKTPASNLPRQTGGGLNNVTLTNYNASGTATTPPANDIITATCQDY